VYRVARWSPNSISRGNPHTHCTPKHRRPSARPQSPWACTRGSPTMHGPTCRSCTLQSAGGGRGSRCARWSVRVRLLCRGCTGAQLAEVWCVSQLLTLKRWRRVRFKVRTHGLCLRACCATGALGLSWLRCGACPSCSHWSVGGG